MIERDEDGFWFHVGYENVFALMIIIISSIIFGPMIYVERAGRSIHRSINGSVYHVKEIQCAKKCGKEFGVNVSSSLDCRGCRCDPHEN